MVQISKWKIALIALCCLYGFVYALPNFIPTLAQQENPGWIPHKTVNLGLDLRGGAHLLYEVDMDGVFEQRVESLSEEYANMMKEGDVGYVTPIQRTERGVDIILKDADDANKIKAMIRRSDPRLYVASGESPEQVIVQMDDSYITEIQDQTISQVIEVVRRRIDELGTTEPVIQRQGDRRVVVQVPGLDSKQIREIIGKTAQLGFHIVSDDQGRRRFNEMSLPYADGPGQLIVKRAALVTGEMLDNAQPTFNESGPVVSFRLNATGSRKFCDVTRKNVGKPFAIILDREVISAPRINEPICGGSGQISGGFDVEEANNLALLLRAGALPADLKVVEERSVGPSLGADSIEAGKIASVIGLVFVLIFMFVSYGLFGLMANIALAVNVALILALLSSLQATLTLPGIAGIVLTVGMAVDANVLIFERIREEVAAGRSAISAIDAGYSRAMATIIDSNLTTLIAAIILFALGTGPIKGFAVTLGIGIVTSFFSAIMVTRLLVVLWLKNVKPKTLPI